MVEVGKKVAKNPKNFGKIIKIFGKTLDKWSKVEYNIIITLFLSQIV